MFGLVLFPLMALLSLFTDSGGGGGSGDGKGAGEGSQGGQDANAGGESGGNGGQGNQQKPGEEASGFKPISTQEDFDAAIKARLAQQERSLTKTITDQVTAELTRQQNEAKAKEQGDYKTLSETQATKIQELEDLIKRRDRAALVSKVAVAHKLPDDLAELLQGEDEAALTEHAKRLAKHVKPATAADTEAGAGNRSGANRPNPAVTKQDGKAPNYSFIPAGAVPIPD